jgi:DNA-binding CsgD family transcriptional regulator
MKTCKTFLIKEEDRKNQVKILSSREKEILSLISQGLDIRQISDRLFISVNKVNNHRQKIISKTKTLNTMQALLYAKRIGII